MSNLNQKKSNFSSIANNFLRFNVYIILGLAAIILILIQPYNSFCRSTQKCHPIMLQSFMPSKLGKKKLMISFKKPANNLFEISLKNNQISAINGAKIKNYISLKNVSNSNHEIILSYKLRNFPNEYIKKLDCPCLLKRNIKAGEEQRVTLHFFIKKEFEEQFKTTNKVNIDVILKPAFK